jgi:amino acid permease
MRGSIFALLASAMGTGMFNLPYRIDQIGVVAYLLFVIIGGLFSYLGMYLISRLILKFKVDSYSSMSERAYGNGFRKVAEFCLIIYPWGIIICYQVIFAKFILQLLADNFNLPFYEGKQGR